MPRYPETQALLEQAVRHVLSEQDKLLKRLDVAELNDILLSLNQLAIDTTNALAEGFNPGFSTCRLTKEALRIENRIDDISESLWTPIVVSVSAIYERIEESLKRHPGKRGLVADVRALYHNLRIGLLEQMIGARMLMLNSDLGDENERIWQQFLERQLGANFRVLRGGQIRDHEGKAQSQQIDLIVVPSDALVFAPGDSEGGKVHVLIDQVIAAIEITSNLTVEKLKQDWRKLQSLPRFDDLENDIAHLKGHPWPLCFILAAHSDSDEDLKKGWRELCEEGLTQVVPQIVLSLDTGYLYSGARRWPSPRFPSNYVEADQVHVETDIYAGLGLGWLIAQLQGRLVAIKRLALGSITRFSNLLNEAMLREGVPPTYSRRFNETTLQPSDIAGVLSWGGTTYYAHNRLLAVDPIV